MGGCVSVHKNADSPMKFRLSVDSKTNQVFIPSPTKETPINGEYPLSVTSFKSQSAATPPVTGFRDFGSKEETFFDSQAWLESDCDDDFLSVNGDFTPSRGNTPSWGNTPNRQNVFFGTPQFNKALFTDKPSNMIPEPSQTGKKKRLSELFQESFEVDKESIDGNLEAKTSKIDLQSKSTYETPCLSGPNPVCSSKRTPSREKLSKSVQCCLPSLVPSRKSSDKKYA